MHLRWLWLAAGCAVGVAQAQRLTSLKVRPTSVNVGQAVEIVADFEVGAGVNCSVRVRYSDGRLEEYHRLNQDRDVPLVLTRKFDKPGDVTVWVEPRTQLPMVKCGGQDLSTTIEVR